MGPNATESVCTAKQTRNKTKRQPSEWEQIFANEDAHEELISQTYKQLLQINIKGTKKPIKTRQKI